MKIIEIWDEFQFVKVRIILVELLKMKRYLINFIEHNYNVYSLFEYNTHRTRSWI